MTEKRFTLMSVVNFDYGINDNDEPIGSLSNICDLLNNLAEENEQLKQQDNINEDCYKKLLQKYDDLKKENEQLKKLLECSRKEANDYCEELMGKDEFIRLYKRQRDEFMEENEQLQQELFESEEECLMINYSDNSVRRDAKIELLKEQFKKRFGKDFE